MAAQAQVEVVMTSDQARFWRDLQKSIEKLGQTKDKLDDVGHAGARAGGKMESDFAGKVIRSIKGATTALIGAEGLKIGIEQVANAWREMAKIGEAAAQRMMGSAELRRQIFRDAGPRGTELAGKALKLSKDFGLSEREGYSLVDTAVRAGSEFTTDENLKFLARLPKSAIPPETVIEANQRLRGAYGRQAPSLSEIVNEILAAMGSSSMSVSELTEAVAMPSVGAKALGMSPEQLIGTLGELSEVFKSPEQAGRKLESLVNILSVKRGELKQLGPVELPQGLEFIKTLPQFAKAGMLRSELGKGKPQTVEQWVGDSKALEAFRVITENQQEVEKRIDAVAEARRQTGTGADLLSTRMSEVEHDPELGIAEWTLRKQSEREAAERIVGFRHELAQGLEDELIADKRRRGAGDLNLWFTKRLFDWGKARGEDPFIEGFKRFGSTETSVRVEQYNQLRREFEESSKSLQDASKALQDAADRLGRGNTTLGKPGADR